MPDAIRLSEIVLPDAAKPGEALPPPRFRNATFASYQPGNESQRDACRAVREFVAEVGSSGNGFRWPWQASRGGRGLYLDGGYGVGKTHLLAAAFHAARDDKAYLTFQELVHFIGALGMAAAGERFASVSLLCIDEFELDDPGNTLIVKRFLEQLFSRGGSVVTTSNTPPEAQGQGRFNADDFRREIQGIAQRFSAVSVVGSDYRQRDEPARLMEPQEFERERAGVSGGRAVVAEFDGLLEVLRNLHPIRYRALLGEFDVLFVADVRRIGRQNDALRFVHFIDQLYDRQVGLRASGETPLHELFDPSYRYSAYQRKHERCVSRLAELLSEPLPAVAGRVASQAAGSRDADLEQAEGFD